MSAVSEIMSPRMVVVLRIESTPTALDAVRLMIKSKVGSVVIVDMDGKPVGILTERDVLKKVTAISKAPEEIPAQDHVIAHVLEPDHAFVFFIEELSRSKTQRHGFVHRHFTGVTSRQAVRRHVQALAAEVIVGVPR